MDTVQFERNGEMDAASGSETCLSILLPGSGHWDGSVADWPGHKFTVSAS